MENKNLNEITQWILENPAIVPSTISAIASIFIAIPAWLAYNTVVVNKVNEK